MGSRIINKGGAGESGQMMFRSLFAYARKKMTGEYGGVIINLSDLATLEFEEDD